jgi:hypothetical protein
MRCRRLLTITGILAVAASGCNGADAGLAEAPVVYETEATDIVLERSYWSAWDSSAQRWRAIPSLIVFGDGTAVMGDDEYDPEAAFHGYVARTITPDGMQALLSRAGDAGLLGPLDLESEKANQIMDGYAVSVTLRANGGTFEHYAYMLGEDGTGTADRDRFADFEDDLDDLSALLGADNVSSERPWVPAAYEIRARAEDEASAGTTVVEWPVDDVDLATAECRQVRAEDLDSITTTATVDTRFRQDGTVYDVWFGPWLPGHSRC